MAKPTSAERRAREKLKWEKEKARPKKNYYIMPLHLFC